MTFTHQRLFSSPPPYHPYTVVEEPVSPTTLVPSSSESSSPACSESSSSSSTISVSPSSSPYASDSIYDILPHYAALPAFNKPPKYSKRLRQLVETRKNSLHLTLSPPPKSQAFQEKQQDLEVVFLDEKSGISEVDNLLPSLPCDEESQYTHHNDHRSRRRRSSSADSESEISWLMFAGLAAILFMVVTSCSVFVAWSTGLFEGDGDLVTHMHVSSVTTVWGTENMRGSGKVEDSYRTTTTMEETLDAEELFLFGEDDDAAAEWGLKKVKTSPVSYEEGKGGVKDSARDKSTRRVHNRRRSGEWMRPSTPKK